MRSQDVVGHVQGDLPLRKTMQFEEQDVMKSFSEDEFQAQQMKQQEENSFQISANFQPNKKNESSKKNSVTKSESQTIISKSTPEENRNSQEGGMQEKINKRRDQLFQELNYLKNVKESTTPKKKKDISRMSDRQKYVEVKRRTKCLYGVENMKRMIDKSKASQFYLQRDPSFIKNNIEIKIETFIRSKTKKKEKVFQLKDLFSQENFIISQNSVWKKIFDTAILLVIGYSCATTVFYVSFNVQSIGFMKLLDDCVTIAFGLDFIFNCFVEYTDTETFLKVRNIKEITKRYAKSGWMIIDFTATFPFDLFIEDAVYTRMIRITRLSKMVAILDVGRVQRMVKAYFDNSTKTDHSTQYIFMYTYKICRLIIIVFMITYLIGSFWWLFINYINTTEDIDSGHTFIQMFDLDQIYQHDCHHDLCLRSKCKEAMNTGLYTNETFTEDCLSIEWRNNEDKGCCHQNTFTQAIIVCYYALTTLSTVGYGDYFPISINEMILGILFMLVGIVFFSQIMGSFIEIIQNYDQRSGNDEKKGCGLNNWMQLLVRFSNQPLPKQLINKIDHHFSYYWANDRLQSLTKQDEYLNQCPRRVKRHIMLHYLFDDIIYKFRGFFNPTGNFSSKFLYDVCFGFRPIQFNDNLDCRLILDEEDEVTDMYFIQDGIVGIGYYLMNQGLSKKQFEIGIQRKANTYFCDYYMCSNQKCEFIYMAMSNVSCISLGKSFFHEKICPKYPVICKQIQECSKLRYKKNVRKVLNEQRQAHILETNKQSHYKHIKFIDKQGYGDFNSQYPEVKPEFFSIFENCKDEKFSDYLSPRTITIGSVDSRADKLNSSKTRLTIPMCNSSHSQSNGLLSTHMLKKEQQLGIKLIQEIPENQTDLTMIIRKRLEAIDVETKDCLSLLKEFGTQADNELEKFTNSMETLHQNLKKVEYISKE